MSEQTAGCQRCVELERELRRAGDSARGLIQGALERAEQAEAERDRLRAALEHITSLPDISSSARRRYVWATEGQPRLPAAQYEAVRAKRPARPAASKT